MEEIKPIKRRFLVRQCQRGTTGMDGKTRYIGDIAIPDSAADFSWFAEIVAVADDCKIIAKDAIGKFVYLCGRHPGLIEAVTEDLYAVKEKIFTERTKARKFDEPFDAGFAALITV